jgi:hypothetical protein
MKRKLLHVIRAMGTNMKRKLLRVIRAMGWLWALAYFVAGIVNLASGSDSTGTSNRILLETIAYLLTGVGPGVIIALLCGRALRKP